MQAENLWDGDSKQNALPDKTVNEIGLKSIINEERIEQQMAVGILLSSLILGLFGNWLFFGEILGINLPLFTLFFLAGAGILLIFFNRPISPPNASFIIPALLFAVFLSIRAAFYLTFFNLIFLFISLFLVICFVSIPEFLGGNPLMPFVAIIQTSFVGWMEGLIRTLDLSNRWLTRTRLTNKSQDTLKSILRGVLITIPIVSIFGFLLASADRIFSRLVSDLLNWLIPNSTENLMLQILLIGFIAWCCMAAFQLMLMGVSPSFGYRPPERQKPFAGFLSMIETGMVLGSVNVLFLIFGLIQARYLFGGTANITAQGYTYSEYARRGFWELLAASCMTMLLILILDFITHRKREHEYLFRYMAFGMIALTGVLLVSSFYRLNLYEDAYGFTRLRVMSSVFIIWLAVLFGILIVDILWRERHIFWMGCLAVGFGFILTLNVINLDGFIAQHNIARYEETDKLDIPYLLTLSDDAIPALVTLLDNPELSSTYRQQLLNGLSQSLYDLDKHREKQTWKSFHIGRNHAWEALDAHREELAPYIHDAPYYRGI